VILFADAGAGYDRPAPRDAVPMWEPAWTEWGNDRCRVRDPEGHEWTFGVHRPGEEVVEGQEW
jgi:uncharacterized glyoxalase superfamily protein PhnB